jgi:hypothetical protein
MTCFFYSTFYIVYHILENYDHLTSLQGRQIPVCLGAFKPRITYWYHGEKMAHMMMILGWSGMRL